MFDLRGFTIQGSHVACVNIYLFFFFGGASGDTQLYKAPPQTVGVRPTHPLVWEHDKRWLISESVTSFLHMMPHIERQTLDEPQCSITSLCPDTSDEVTFLGLEYKTPNLDPLYRWVVSKLGAWGPLAANQDDILQPPTWHQSFC